MSEAVVARCPQKRVVAIDRLVLSMKRLGCHQVCPRSQSGKRDLRAKLWQRLVPRKKETSRLCSLAGLVETRGGSRAFEVWTAPFRRFVLLDSAFTR